MIKLGVIGYPLKHTLSPVMHNPALKKLGLEGIYLPFEIEPGRLEEAAKGFVALGFRGYNVTIPYKVDIMPYLDTITKEAQSVGAVNTVIIDAAGKTTGDNTDVYGFVASLSEEDQQKLKGTHAVIIGAGGASRAVATGLIQLGAAKISLYDMSLGAAEATKAVLDTIDGSSTTIEAKSIDSIDITGASILVNANPVGMHPNVDQTAINTDLLDSMNNHGIVFDLIYRPAETLLLKTAKEKGFTTYNGVEMLVQQGAKALEKWVNKPVPVDVMRNNLIEALK